MSIQVSTGKRTVSVNRYRTNSSDDRLTTGLVISYTRPQRRKWGVKKQAYIAAAIAVFVWISYNVLVMSDVRDTKPTVHLSFQGQP
jgi:hypothetical protein